MYIYLENNHSELNVKTLLDLTDPRLMPKIGPEAALGYTALVKEVESKAATKHWRQLADLCRRCNKVAVRNKGWNEVSCQSAVDHYLKEQVSSGEESFVDSLLFASSLSTALEQAQDDYGEMLTQQEALMELVRDMNNSIAKMENSNQKKDEHLMKQMKAVEKARMQIVGLQSQITEIKRKHGESEMQKRKLKAESRGLVNCRCCPEATTDEDHVWLAGTEQERESQPPRSSVFCGLSTYQRQEKRELDSIESHRSFEDERQLPNDNTNEGGPGMKRPRVVLCP